MKKRKRWYGLFLILVFLTVLSSCGLSSEKPLSSFPSSSSGQPIPTSVDAIENYLIQARSKIESVAADLEEIGKVLAKYPDVSSYPEYVWSKINEIKEATAEFMGVVAPSEIHEFDSKVKEAMSRFSWAMDYLTQAASGPSLDYGMVEKAIPLLDCAADYLSEANFIKLPNSGYANLKILKFSTFLSVEKANYQAEQEKKRQEEISASHYHNGPLELVDYWTESDYFCSYIVGIVKNNSPKTIRYVEIRWKLFDENKNQIGTAFDNITNLGGNSTWKFKCMVLEEGCKKFQLDELTYLDY